ncbi:M48 family metallopeptidase [Caldimonas sp.]|uniref:M48 family metallopeptidase n=1 Tax=Caldimonas sp. TaxID=2838790 RepID=UPI00307E98DB
MQSDTLALLFAAVLIAHWVVKVWLASRQIRHVARHRERVPAGFEATIPLEAHRRAADYTIAKTRFSLLSDAFAAAVLLGWTLLGGLDALNVMVRDAVQPVWGDLAYQLTLLAAVAVIGWLLDLPFDAWATFRIEQRFGFNRMSVGLFLADLVKAALVGALIGLPLAALVLWLMGAAGPSWWLWAWAVWVGFNLLMLVLYPTLIAPLFNTFEPLADEGLRQRVEGLMARCGFAAKGLYVMDGSKRSAHANAYFTGFGAAKRVVFFDTLLNKLSPGEVEAVLAHELGHFKRRHVLKRMVGLFGLSLLGFALLGWLSGQAWFYTGLGVQPNLAAPNDALALLLFMMVAPVVGTFLLPWMAAVSRRHEYEADAYACAQASGQDLSRALLKLYEDNASTLTPDPWYVRFYYSHPPAAQRLAAMRALTRNLTASTP